MPENHIKVPLGLPETCVTHQEISPAGPLRPNTTTRGGGSKRTCPSGSERSPWW